MEKLSLKNIDFKNRRIMFGINIKKQTTCETCVCEIQCNTLEVFELIIKTFNKQIKHTSKEQQRFELRENYFLKSQHFFLK